MKRVLLLAVMISATSAFALNSADEDARQVASQCLTNYKPCAENGHGDLLAWRRLHKGVVPDATPTCDFPTDMKSPKVVMTDGFVKQHRAHNISLVGSIEQVSEGIIGACSSGDALKKSVVKKIKTIRFDVAVPIPPQDPVDGPIPTVKFENGDLVVGYYDGCQGVADAVQKYLSKTL